MGGIFLYVPIRLYLSTCEISDVCTYRSPIMDVRVQIVTSEGLVVVFTAPSIFTAIQAAENAGYKVVAAATLN